jgi:MFS family permease
VLEPPTQASPPRPAGAGWLGFTRYQWVVIAAAWLGWGFDVFDALLFNFVAPSCIPTLLNLPLGSAAARSATVFWTGVITSILLIGWALGGVLFGLLADRIGRQRTLFITILVYSVGTALCASATDITQLIAFRALASLGIGGEWAVGAALVAESVPESKRVEAGAILYTASPLGLALASFLNYQIAGVWMVDTPEVAWRYVFLCGLIPVAVALGVRLLLRESERWREAARNAPAPALGALFAAGMRGPTFSGLFTAVMALLAWWSCNAFLPIVASNLAHDVALTSGLDATATTMLAERWKADAANWFNFGALAGTLLVIPLAKRFGRRAMFGVYFALSLLSLLANFGFDLPPEWRIRGYFAIGISVYGVFAAFTFYLPELFPTRLRGLGAGFCYNFGRIVAAGGPFVVGAVSMRAGGSSAALLETQLWVAIIPLIALAGTRWIVETHGRALPP